MSARNLKRTGWARRFKREAPYHYAEALSIAERLHWVVLERRDDHSAKGDYLWAILPDIEPEFWLDATPTRAEAQAICAALGWPIKETEP